MLDFLARYLNLDRIPERQAEAQALLSPAAPPPPVDDSYILDALARARGYPSAQALAAAEPHLVGSYQPPEASAWQGDRTLTPDEFESQMQSLESWLGPLDNVSRLLGALATGQDPRPIWDSRVMPEDRPPTIGEALVEGYGAPQLVGLASEFLVPDGMGPFDEILKGIGAMAIPASRMLRRRPDLLDPLMAASGSQGNVAAFFNDIRQHLGFSGGTLGGDMYARLEVPTRSTRPGRRTEDATLSISHAQDGPIEYAYINSMQRPAYAAPGDRSVAEAFNTTLYWADRHQVPVATTPAAFSHASMDTDGLRRMYNSLGFEPNPHGSMVRHPMPLEDAALLRQEDELRQASFRAFNDPASGLSNPDVRWRLENRSYSPTSRVRLDPDTGQVVINHVGSDTWEPYLTIVGQRVRVEGNDVLLESADGTVERFRPGVGWDYGGGFASTPDYGLRGQPQPAPRRPSRPAGTSRAEPPAPAAPDPFANLRLADYRAQALFEYVAGDDPGRFLRQFLERPSLARREAFIEQALYDLGYNDADMSTRRDLLMQSLDRLAAQRGFFPSRVGGNGPVRGMQDAVSALGRSLRLNDLDLDTAVDRVLAQTGMTRDEFVEHFVDGFGAADQAETTIIQALTRDGDSLAEAREMAASIREAYEGRIGISYEYPDAFANLGTPPADAQRGFVADADGMTQQATRPSDPADASRVPAAVSIEQALPNTPPELHDAITRLIGGGMTQGELDMALTRFFANMTGSDDAARLARSGYRQALIRSGLDPDEADRLMQGLVAEAGRAFAPPSPPMPRLPSELELPLDIIAQGTGIDAERVMLAMAEGVSGIPARDAFRQQLLAAGLTEFEADRAIADLMSTARSREWGIWGRMMQGTQGDPALRQVPPEAQRASAQHHGLDDSNERVDAPSAGHDDALDMPVGTGSRQPDLDAQVAEYRERVRGFEPTLETQFPGGAAANAGEADRLDVAAVLNRDKPAAVVEAGDELVERMMAMAQAEGFAVRRVMVGSGANQTWLNVVARTPEEADELVRLFSAEGRDHARIAELLGYTPDAAADMATRSRLLDEAQSAGFPTRQARVERWSRERIAQRLGELGVNPTSEELDAMLRYFPAFTTGRTY